MLIFSTNTSLSKILFFPPFLFNFLPLFFVGIYFFLFPSATFFVLFFFLLFPCCTSGLVLANVVKSSVVWVVQAQPMLLTSSMATSMALFAAGRGAVAPLSSISARARLAKMISPSRFMGSGTALKDVTEADVIECQNKWANAITSISGIYKDKGDYVAAAASAAGELYGYGHSQVLFKPTKAAEFPFRPTGEEAMSYFVGGGAVDNGYSEDAGFAINGGKGWSKVVFSNHAIDLNGPVAIAMGTYDFTCATTNEISKVEYTFGYKRNKDGKPRIFLHHSSVPYKA